MLHRPTSQLDSRSWITMSLFLNAYESINNFKIIKINVKQKFMIRFTDPLDQRTKTINHTI